MLSGKCKLSDGVINVKHPRTGKQIRKFGVKKIILWNATGTLGGAFEGLGEEDTIGTYGVIELHDKYDTVGGSSPTVADSDCIMRIPVSGKSRLVLELPGNGLIFKSGILIKIGTEKSSNSGHYIHYQLVGYEYSAG